MDQSSTEANSIKQVFSQSSHGEQECEVILCMVHVMRMWISKVYDKKAWKTMVLAMHKRTRIGFEQLVKVPSILVYCLLFPNTSKEITRTILTNELFWHANVLPFFRLLPRMTGIIS